MCVHAGGTLVHNVTSSWTDIKEMLLSYNWTSSLRALSLPRFGLRGALGMFAPYLSQLKVLDLAENALTGPLPAELGSTLSGMLHLNLSHNALYGAQTPMLDVPTHGGAVYGCAILPVSLL